MAQKSKSKSRLSRALSFAKNVGKKVVSGVKSAGKNVVSTLGSAFAKVPRSVNTASLGVLGTSAPKGVQQYSSPIGPRNRPPSGVQQYSSPIGPVNAPRTVTGGTKTSSGGSVLRTSANTSSSAFDTGYGLSEDDIASFSQPRSYTVNSDALGSGGVGVTGVSAVLPSSPSTPDYSGDIALTNASLGIGTTPQTATTDEVSNPQSSFDAYLKQQEKDQAKYEKDSANALKQAREDAGIEEAQQRVQNTQNQINTITANMNADLLRLRGTAAKEGVTEAVYGGQQAQVTREATIKLLPLQAQLAADQGNLEQAEDNLNTLYSLYSKQVESRYNFHKQVLDKTYEFFTAAEKRKLDQQDKLDQRKVDYFNKQNDYLHDLTSKALDYGLKTGSMSAFRQLSKLQLPPNYTDKDWPRQMQNIMNDAGQIVATRMVGSGIGGSQYATDLDAIIGTVESIIPTKFGQETFRNQIAKSRNDSDKINIVAAQILKGQPAEFKRDFANQAVGVSMIDKAIKELDSGVQTGFINNGVQYTYNVFGKDFDPKMAKINSYITSAIQPYRNSVTGAAWGEQEDNEYASLFGSTKFSPPELRQRLVNVKELLKAKSVEGLNAFANPLGTYDNPFAVGNLASGTTNNPASDVWDSVVGKEKGGYWSNLWSAITGK